MRTGTGSIDGKRNGFFAWWCKFISTFRLSAGVGVVTRNSEGSRERERASENGVENADDDDDAGE